MTSAYLSLPTDRTSRRYRADWADSEHHFRRLISEFIGTFGLVGVLSFGAAILSGFSHPPIGNVGLVALLSAVSSLWLIVAIYALGDLSAHSIRP